MKSQSKIRIVIITILVLIIAVMAVFLVNNNHSTVNKFPPYQSAGYKEQKTDDEKVRYALTDIQLGGVEDYYRGYIQEDPNIQKAIGLWDSGVRIVNIYQFNRVKIADKGWQVVYGGTDTIVDCSDMVITDDIGATGNDNARIRYILADAQLGGVIDYYRQYINDPSTAEAVKLWNQGIRVVNINQFERIIVGNAGWKVVYAKTDATINGTDVVLTSDPATESTALNLDNVSCDDRPLWDWQQIPGQYKYNEITGEERSYTLDVGNTGYYFSPEETFPTTDYDCGTNIMDFGRFIPGFPQPGLAFTWSGSCISTRGLDEDGHDLGIDITQNWEVVVTGWESKTTNLGIFNSLRVDTKYTVTMHPHDPTVTESQGSGQTTDWYVCGYGLIYSVSSHERASPWELLSFTPLSR
jgi:hypothetical protein